MVDPGSTLPPNQRRRNGGCLPALVVLVVILGLGFGASKLFGDDHKKSSSSSSSSSGSHDSGEWKVGDCGGPDPDDKPNGYKAFGCGDAGATFKALDIQPASFMPDSIQCPAGTDLIIQVSVSYGSSKSKGGGIPSKTVCGRNISADHPGDAGAGGGQLVKGDCVTSTAKEVPCASGGSDTYKVLDLTKETAQCPTGTTEPMRLTMAIGRPYDVICTAKQ
ncbi:hypothetical protein [Streptomyces violascens]|uniref:Secreted protein n=1 Tax=Streptomyces violascens TaxID=67381 RepID=A0ABQ3QG12_9ACTN|nr:hypothetical protein [Streptomyces violascens]GGT88397.1 hypothetical protein GCM10010289_05510 [Streptomyces violascens]GHI36217.1 hypothetical protein Sviol_06250 [Streptomyces violascens]